MLWLQLLLLAVAAVYVFLKWTFSFWARKGFPYAAANIPFGALDSVRRNQRSFGMAIYDIYVASKKPFVGIYLTIRPALLVRDAHLAHDILVKDFASFHDRGIYVDEKRDPLSAHLFGLEGSSWKTLRTKLTPSFTSGKLKGMFGTSEAVADKLLAHLDKHIPQTGSQEFEIKQLMSYYASDIIASTIFGLDVDSFLEPENHFNDISNAINLPTVKNIVRNTTGFLYPGMERIFNILGWQPSGQMEMRELVHRMIAYREENNVGRRDILQLLLQLRNTGKVSKDEDIWSTETAAESLKTLSKDNIAAQMFLFFAAGFETTASAISFTLYELMQNPDVLAKLMTDINETLEKYNGEICYDSIQDMKYLELCVMESIRKYPGLPILNRICTQDYALSDSKLVIEKGTQVIISLLGIHRDEEYFPDPLRYQPERFTDEHRNYTPAAYMPFGEGPRHCIAARMGKINVKTAVVKILTNFEIETREEKREIEFSAHGVALLSEGGVPIKLSRKKQTNNK